jgi:SAM-dependent methyltransferase
MAKRFRQALALTTSCLSLCDRFGADHSNSGRSIGAVYLLNLVTVYPFLELYACPACAGALTSDWSCSGCGARFETSDGIPNLRLPSDTRSELVRSFYEHAPFPAYPPGASLSWLRARAERSEFARLVDHAISGDARILDLGCGTGQMSLYLARARRVIIGADLARGSLQLGAAAARRFQLDQVQFVETDLHRPGLREGAFDVVYSSGVLHHTPDPRAAFSRIARLVRPGGMIILGLYNTFARIPFRLRRLVAWLSGYRWIPFDPVLCDRENEPARREAWLRDQYRHPEEHRHTLAEVQAWFAENGFEYIRAYPSAMLSQESEPDDLFASAPDNWRPEGWLAQIGWIGSLGHEGGLFVTIGRRV